MGWRHNWNAVDWSRTDREIADELGARIGTVRRHRRGLRLRGGKRGRPPVPEVAWDGVPLGILSDAQCAERLGLSDTSVANKRRRCGIVSATDPQAAPVLRERLDVLTWRVISLLREVDEPEVVDALGGDWLDEARRVLDLALAHREPLRTRKGRRADE